MYQCPQVARACYKQVLYPCMRPTRQGARVMRASSRQPDTRHRCCSIAASVVTDSSPSPASLSGSRASQSLPISSSAPLHNTSQHSSIHCILPIFTLTSLHPVSLIVRHHEDGDRPCGLGRLRYCWYASHAAEEGAFVGTAGKPSLHSSKNLMRRATGDGQ